MWKYPFKTNGFSDCFSCVPCYAFRWKFGRCLPHWNHHQGWYWATCLFRNTRTIASSSCNPISNRRYCLNFPILFCLSFNILIKENTIFFVKFNQLLLFSLHFTLEFKLRWVFLVRPPVGLKYHCFIDFVCHRWPLQRRCELPSLHMSLFICWWHLVAHNLTSHHWIKHCLWWS